jgi:VIT1/CCC1 family predicted Fe2+/Mn2+ transporter
MSSAGIPVLEHRMTQAEARIAKIEEAVNRTERAVISVKAWILAGATIIGALVPIVSFVIAKAFE